MTLGPTLITGVLGQIGSRCAAWAELDGPVGALDLLRPPSESAFRFADYIQHDLREPLPDSAVRRLTGYKTVIHIAGSRADSPFSSVHAREVLTANAAATAHLLAALPGSIERFILVSSVSVYGHPRTIPVGEDAPLRPITAYGASKAAAERLSRIWANQRKTRLSIVRLTQIYGPGTSSRNGMYRMIAAALGGNRITVSSRPDLLRDYLHVDDAARLLYELARMDISGAVNVGSGSSVQIGDLAARIADLAGGPAPVLEEPSRGFDLLLDTTRMLAHGLSPSISLSSGLESEVRRLASGL